MSDKVIEWINNRKNQYLVLIIIGILVIIMLVVSLFKNIDAMKVNGAYPNGRLTEEVAELPVYIDREGISFECMFPSVKYECRMPYTSEINKDRIIAEYNNAFYAAVVSGKEDEEVIERELPLYVATPVLGEEPDARLEIHENGYLYDKKASYYAYTVRTKIGIQTLVTYSICYVIESESGNKLYLYACTNDKDAIQSVFDTLWNIVSSVKVVSDVDAWISEHNKEGSSDNEAPGEPDGDDVKEEEDDESKEVYDSGSPGGYYQDGDGYVLDALLMNEHELENGVILLSWTNVLTEPSDVYVKDESGTKYYKDEELSYNGHYVFKVGKHNMGAFYITGYTSEMLDDCCYYFMEMEQYNQLFVDKYIVPREE